MHNYRVGRERHDGALDGGISECTWLATTSTPRLEEEAAASAHLPTRGRAGRAGGHLLGASLQRRFVSHLLCRAVSRGGDPLQQGAYPPKVWIEHYPPETTDGRAESFELVIFSSYEVMEGAPCLGKTRLTVV